MSDYKLVFEDEKQLLFREIESKRWVKFIILTILGLFIIWPIFIHEFCNLTGPIWIFPLIGGFCFFSGIFVALSKGYVRLDKGKEIVEYYVGKQKYFFKPKLIPFNKIDGVLAKTVFNTAKYGRLPDIIAIELYVRDYENLKIFNTYDEILANEITAKLRDFIGCHAYSINE